MYKAFLLLVSLALVGCHDAGGAGAPVDASTGGSDDGSSAISTGDATALAPDGAAAQGDAGPFALTSLDEPCEGGPTGRQLLAYVESSYRGTYDPPAQIAASPSAVTITAAYDGGAIECTPAPPFTCCPGCPCRTPPPPSVRVNLDVGFKTADGTLNESFAATATFSPDVYEVMWTATLPVAMVHGTYPFSAGSTDLAFNGNFRNSNTGGSIAEERPPAPGSSTLSGGTWTASAMDGGTD